MKGRCTAFLLFILVCLAEKAFAFETATRLIISGSSTEVAGSANDLSITAADALGAPDTNYDGPKTLVFSGASPSINPVHSPTVSDQDGKSRDFGSPTSIAFQKGVAAVKGQNDNGQMHLYRAGTFAISATDGTISSAGPGDLTVTVTPGSLSGFDVSVATPQNVGTSFTGTNTIAAHDSLGNAIADFDASKDNVTLSSSLGGALSGLGSAGKNVLNRSTDFTGGISDLSSRLVYSGPAGNGTLLASASSGKSGNSNSYTMLPGDAVQLAFAQQPANTKQGAVITPAVTVQVQDQSGNSVAQAGINIALALNSGTGTLAGTLQRVTDATGLATFNDLTIDQFGSKQLAATATGLTSATSQSFTIIGPASKLVIQTQPPSTSTAGMAFSPQPVIAVTDGAGNIITTENSTVVTVQESPGGPGGLTGTLSVAAVNGIASFADLAETKIGSFSLQFTSQPALTPVTSNNIVVSAATASKLVYNQQPANTVAGAPITPSITVQLIDAYNNNVAKAGVPVTMSLNAGTGTLGGTTIRDSNGSGLASFNDLSINSPGQKVLLASSGSLASALSASFQIAPGAATQMTYTQQPSAVVAGATISPAVTVQLLDSSGNSVTTDGVAVTLALNGSGALGGTLTRTTANGIATFNDLSIQQSGQKTLTASSAGLTSATSQTFAVSPGAAANTAFVQQPSNATADAVISPPVTVQLRDVYGNGVPNAGVAVTMSLSSGTGPLAGSLTKNTDATGLATFNDLNVNSSGDKVLTATANGLTAGVSSTFTISAGVPASLAFVQQPTDAASGATITPPVTVQLKDAHGNNPTTDGVAITLSLNGTGALNGTVTRNTSNGIATFGDLNITQVGQKSLTASSSGLGSKQSQTFTITAGAAAKLIIQRQPSATAIAGSVFTRQPIVAITDSSGNVNTSDNSTVVTAHESAGGPGGLQGTTSVTVVNGVATFTDLAETKAGTITLDFTSQPALLPVTSSNIAVSAGSAARLAFVQPPTNAVAGATITPPVTVQLRDAFENNVARSGVAVTVSLTSGTGNLSGSTTRNTNGTGLATFSNLKIGTSGEKVLTASSNGLTSAVSSPFTIGAGAASALSIQTQPSPTAVAGVPFTQQPIIALVDGSGNVAANDNTTTVTAQESSNSTTLQGTVTVKAVNGVVTFTNLSLTKSGTYTLQFSSQPALTGAVSNGIVVSAGAAAKLVFVQQPTNVSAGAPITPPATVQLRDAFDNDVAAGGVAITMSLSTGTGTLSGTPTHSTSTAGLASFNDLSVNTTGDKTLTASSTGLQSVTSQTFTVAAGSANQLAFVQQPGNTVAGAVLSPAVTVRIIDASGNTNPVDGTPIRLSVASGDTLFGTITKNTISGIATFDSLQLKVAGQKTLVASSLGLPAISSSAFTVTPGAAARVAIETAANGTGTLLAAQSIASGSFITVYAITRDAFGNFIANGSADSWSLQNVIGGVAASDLTPSADKKSARFTGRVSGSAVIVASVSGLSSVASGVVTVTASSNLARVFVETAADGSGIPLGDRTLTAGGKLTVYAVARDSANNFVRNVVADQWGLQNATGGIAQQDLTPSADKKSVTFTAHLAGQARIQALVGGIAGTPSGLVTVVAGSAAKLEIAAGGTQETQINTEFPQRLVARVTDAFGNPVGGVTVTFTAPANGPGGTFSGGTNTAISDAAGVATAPAFVANSFSGIFTVTASAPGIGSPVTFTLTNKSGVGANIAVVEGTSQSAAVGTSFTTRFKVTVKDDAGNAVGGALVHFSAPASGPSGNFAGGLVDSARTTAAGEATSSAFTANYVAGSYSIIASTESGKTVNISLTNLPGPLTRFAVESDKGGRIDTQYVGVRFNIRIRALDSYDNAVTSFSEGIVITSTGDLFVGAGTTPPFNAGVLASYTVGFQKTGSFTIVATHTGGGASGTSNAFFVGNPRPLVRGVSPSSGLAGQTVVASLLGRGFLAGVSSVSFGDGIATSTVVENDSVMTVTLQIENNASPGSRDVTVINAPPVGGVAFLANGFTIGDHPKPTVSSILPSSAAQLQSVRLFIRGTNFLGNGFSHLFFTGDGITVDSASVDSSTVIRADVSVGAAASLGPRDVVIVNDGPGGGTDTLYRAFSVTPGVLAAPVLLQPPNGAQSQPSTVTLTWQASPGAVSYQIQLARDAAFADMIVSDSTANTSYQVGPLPNNSVYSWHVRALSGGGSSAWSNTWSFDNLPPIPATISLNNTVDFPDHPNPSDYTTNDYRIVGLPGGSNSRLNNFIPGIQDVEWRVFWDNGGATGYLVSFDGSSTFTFVPGRAFWMLKKGPWAVNVTIAAAPVDSVTRSALIPLHSGWNLITNPMTWPIPWSVVQAANGTSEPIYGFEGLYNRSDSLAPYIGYYFFDDPATPLGVLKIPYGPGLGKNVVHKTSPDSSNAWTLHVDLRVGKYVDQSTSLGVNPLASPGKDRLDFHRPRSFGDMPSVYFPRPEWDSLFSSFASDIRPPFEDKSSWRFAVASKGPKGGELQLEFRGLQAVPPGMEIYLVDEAGASAHDLKQEGAKYRFVPGSPATTFTLLVGKKRALANDLAGVLPRMFSLDQNYPNPFNPSTAIPVSLPVRANVELKIYNVLGQEVKTLLSGSLEAGRHVFLWDGTNSVGNSVATGMYIARFTSDNGVRLGRKMLLLR